MTWTVCGILSVTLMLSSCGHRAETPFAVLAPAINAHLNQRSLRKLESRSEGDDDRLSIAIVSATRGNLGEFDRIVDEINADSDLDFAVHLGDFTEDGSASQYERFLAALARLSIPVFVLPGNQDTEGDGLRLFERVFGLSNFSFRKAGLHFVFLHSTGRVEKPHLDPNPFLRGLVPSDTEAIVFMHVPLPAVVEQIGPRRPRLDGDLPFRMVVSGHLEGAGVTGERGVVLVRCPRARGKRWLRVDIGRGELGRQVAGRVSFKESP